MAPPMSILTSAFLSFRPRLGPISIQRKVLPSLTGSSSKRLPTPSPRSWSENDPLLIHGTKRAVDRRQGAEPQQRTGPWFRHHP
jgi:hypothetical protein